MQEIDNLQNKLLDLITTLGMYKRGLATPEKTADAINDILPALEEQMVAINKRAC